MNSDDITGISPQKNHPKNQTASSSKPMGARTKVEISVRVVSGEYLYGDCIYVWEIANRHVDIYTSIYTRQDCVFMRVYVDACICHMHMYTHIYIYTLYVHMTYICTYIHIHMHLHKHKNKNKNLKKKKKKHMHM